MNNKITLVLLFLILILATYLRFDGVMTKTFAFTYDVGRDMLALQQIEITHKVPLIGFTTGVQGIFYGPWWYYILFPAFVIVRGDPQGIAGFVALLGVAAVFLAYMLGKRIYDRSLGIFLAGMLAVSPLVIAKSTQIWNPNLSPIVTMAVFLLLFLIYINEKKSMLLSFGLGFCLTLLLDAEIVYGILTFLASGVFVVVFLRNKFSLRTVISFILGFILVLLPRIIFEVRHSFLMTNNAIHILMANVHASQSTDFISAFINRISIIANVWSDSIANGNIIMGWIFFLASIAGLVIAYRRKEKESIFIIWYTLITLIIFIIGLTLFHGSVWDHFYVGIPLVVTVLFSVGVWNLLSMTPSFIRLLVCLGLFIFVLNPIGLYNNSQKPYWIGDASVYRNQLQVIDYVYQQAQNRPFKDVVYTPDVYSYTYQYLFSWYGENKYFYQPSVNAPLAFFIVEPDTQYHFRDTQWLQQRKNDGVVKKSHTFPSGILVQTRLPE